MKKVLKKIIIGLCVVFSLCVITSCTNKTDEKKIVVGASSTPHAEILEFAKSLIEAKGYELDIRVFSDYVTPNLALEDESLDANYFQHLPYLEDFNEGNGTNLVSAGAIHYEPLALYGKNIASVEQGLKQIIIPNDGSNGSRALLLLDGAGIIELNEGIDPTETITRYDIADYKGYEIIEADADLIPSLYLEGDTGTLAVINGNYALEANIDINSSLIKEEATGLSATVYANIIAVRSGTENDEKIKVLIEVLKSVEVRNYITNTYNGAVLPSE